MRQFLSLILMLFLFIFTGSAQNFGIGTNSPKASSILDVTASNKGVILPRISLTSATDIATISLPDTSLLIYNSATAGSGNNKVMPGFYYWSGSRWLRIVNATDTVATSITDSNPDIDTTSCTSSGIVIRNPNLIITDNDIITGISDVIPLSGISGTVCKIEVGVRINHTWDADLDIYLTAPNGTTIELSTDNGSSNDDYGTGSGPPYVYTVFSDAATTSILSGLAPFAGSYQPETALSLINGISANGNWTLKIYDDLAGDIGTLVSWQLNVYNTSAAGSNWTLIKEIPISAINVASLIASASYSCDPQSNGGVKTALTVNTSSAGAVGTSITNLPGTTLFRSAASPTSGTGNYWVSTCMQAEQNNLIAGQMYYYQVWRKGLVEAGNENCSLIVTRQAK